jgi:hypothetical protein
MMAAEAYFRLSLLALFSLACSKIHPFDENEPKQVPCFTQGHRPFTAAIFPNRFCISERRITSRHLIFCGASSALHKLSLTFSPVAQAKPSAHWMAPHSSGETILGAQISEHQQCMREVATA